MELKAECPFARNNYRHLSPFISIKFYLLYLHKFYLRKLNKRLSMVYAAKVITSFQSCRESCTRYFMKPLFRSTLQKLSGR